MRNNIFIILFFLSTALHAQVENKSIQQGNEKYRQNDYTGAENAYKEGLEKNASSEAGNYNLGNAYYQQQKFDEALKQYQSIADNTKDPVVRSDAYHNMGNVLLQQKQYEESINAYKNALKANPEDADTKYNLAYAQAMIKKQQQQNQDKNKKDQDKKNDQDNPDKKKDENPNQEQKENKDEPENNDEKKDQQPQQAEKKQYSKEEMDRILQALNNEDKKVQDKINKQKTASQIKVEKDW